jgi:hypothetical protein
MHNLLWHCNEFDFIGVLSQVISFVSAQLDADGEAQMRMSEFEERK